MTGHLGETAGKNGRPELPVVKSMTLVEMGERLTELLGTSWVEIKLVRSAGHYAARIESRGCSGHGGGSDPDRAILRAIARLGVNL